MSCIVGYGVFTKRHYEKDKFVLEYAGDPIWAEDCHTDDYTYIYSFFIAKQEYW